ncbi:ester cyclase [Mycobacterium sp.]|uniref:ester cyclase n=1 Tax=Mycobacterium sp. TaxID=1785 RepID=UPI002BB7EC80|nr:ester cyclase [Mycobacterium sp.]HTQ21879.1 ester cyclase [Mycobacterium sp.]
MGATEDSRALMWRITDEIWNNGRLELIDELIAEDLVDHVELVGLEGDGRARYRASVELTRAAFPDYQNPLDLVLADGDYAVSYGRSTGTHRGEYLGIPPTGRSFDVPTWGILRFADGQAVERWGLADNLAMIQQLGLMG